MATILTPEQVPKLWNAIKFTAVQANGGKIKEQTLPVFLNKLLATLLDGTSQCFIREDSDQLNALAITQITIDPVSGERYLLLLYLYSFKVSPMDRWLSDLEDLKKFAKENNCTRIVLYSDNERIFELAKASGLSEYFRCFTLGLVGA